MLGTVVAFLALLVGAEAVPDGAITARLADAVEDGGYGPPLVPDPWGGLHDGFTECVALGHGLGTPPEPMGLVARALWAPRIGACDAGADQVRALAAGEDVAAGPYYRYWNGYAPLTRPVVAVLGVPGLRVVVGAALLAAAVVAAVALGRRLGWLATAALAGPLVVASNAAATPAGSFTHAISLAAAAIGTAGVAVATDRWGWPGAAGAAAGGAALFVFVDLLTTPALPWALAATVAGGVVAARGADLRDVGCATLAAGVAWPAAYAVTWATRWLAAAAVHGRQVLSAIAEVSRFRVSGQHGGVVDQVGAATRANADWWLDRTTGAPVVLALAVAVSVGAIVLLLRRRDAPGPGLAVLAVLAAPALLVPAWYELVSNHSQIHAFFTYRSVPVAVGIGTAACVLAAQWHATPAAGDQP